MPIFIEITCLKLSIYRQLRLFMEKRVNRRLEANKYILMPQT